MKSLSCGVGCLLILWYYKILRSFRRETLSAGSRRRMMWIPGGTRTLDGAYFRSRRTSCRKSSVQVPLSIINAQQYACKYISSPSYWWEQRGKAILVYLQSRSAISDATLATSAIMAYAVLAHCLTNRPPWIAPARPTGKVPEVQSGECQIRCPRHATLLILEQRIASLKSGHR